MIKAALEYLIGLGKKEVIEVGGQKFIAGAGEFEKVTEPKPEPLSISTLTGLVDYIKNNIDKVEGRMMLHVEDFKTVRLVSPLKGDMKRNSYVLCGAETPTIIFSNFMDAERFNIMLQSCFLDSGDRATILKLVGNIEEVNGKNSIDDGITQRVTARTGIKLADEVVVPNPVTLVPFMTFAEIEQPDIKYVFRMKEGPYAALYEADGGAWKLQTMHNVKKYLEKELAGLPVDIIA